MAIVNGHVTFEITDACNLKCKYHCSTRQYHCNRKNAHQRTRTEMGNTITQQDNEIAQLMRQLGLKI